MDDVLGVCSEKLKNNDVKFILDLNDPIFEKIIECRRVQISQIFVNLIGNAFDAVENRDDRWIKLECQLNNEFIEFKLNKFLNSSVSIPFIWLFCNFKYLREVKPLKTVESMWLIVIQR